MPTSLKPNLMTEDVNRSVEFYRDLLGFRFAAAVAVESREIVTDYQADLPLQWAMVQRGDAEIMFQSRASLAQDAPYFAEQPLGASLVLYLEVEGLDELFAAVKDRVEIVLDLRTTFYGMREAWIRDCNGYVLTLAEAAEAQ
jgi:uncharacterized glyoxalase superfamily protein PhnB